MEAVSCVTPPSKLHRPCSFVQVNQNCLFSAHLCGHLEGHLLSRGRVCILTYILHACTKSNFPPLGAKLETKCYFNSHQNITFARTGGVVGRTIDRHIKPATMWCSVVDWNSVPSFFLASRTKRCTHRESWEQSISESMDIDTPMVSVRHSLHWLKRLKQCSVSCLVFTGIAFFFWHSTLKQPIYRCRVLDYTGFNLSSLITVSLNLHTHGIHHNDDMINWLLMMYN